MIEQGVHMEADSTFSPRPRDDSLDQLILSEFLYPIAVNYQRLLETQGWEAKVRKCIEVFEYGLRAITLGVLSQYLIRDVHQVSDPELDKKLYRNLAQASLGQWTEFFFLGLRAYRGRRELLFMPELYDLYWDTSQEPHQPREGIRGPFDRLVQIRNDLAHRLPPGSEEGWKALGQEVSGHLRAVLEQFDFLQRYDLIRVVGQRGEEYEYERFTGQEITTRSERLRGQRKDEKLRPGWFYLSRQDRSVLQLHPLFIFWTDGEESKQAGDRRQDAAVYDRLLKEAVEYVAVVVQQMVEKRDTDLLAQFRDLLFYNIEHVKMARKRTVLSWEALQRAAKELTAEQMGAVREKYQRALYLQRNETFGKLQEFLSSEKGCFVLTGKSGVGKSNFVLSLTDEFADQQDLCLLMYNGARLSVPDKMVQAISQDLARYLTLEGEAAVDLFAELEQQGKMAGKTLLLVFDAINENLDGKALLQQIDQMVGEMRYPWLKVVITSRPQAWRTLKRGLRLADDRYFRERGKDECWVELEGFTYAEEVQLKPFDWEELPKVYANYQKTYRLQTPYESLPAQLRSVLCDPLMLRLVARIHQGQSIPNHVQISDIYEQYVQVLVATERLTEGDLFFLEQEIVPLMIAEGQYRNKLTATRAQRTRTQDGRPLWELIRSDDTLSNGQPVNAGYMRLADAEILVAQGPPTDYEIAFKYERFYDYFAGKRLFSIAESKDAKLAFYQELVAQILNTAYLWGPIKSALVLELMEHADRRLIILLAETTSQVMKEMLVAVLGEYGWDEPSLVRTILFTLLESKGRPAKLWEHISSVFPGRQERISGATLQHRVAVEAAYEANLPDVLGKAACHPSSGTRTISVQYIHYLWKKGQQEAVIGILADLRDHLMIWRIPKPHILFSCAGISALLLFTEYRNRQVLGVLQDYWREILRTVLFIQPKQSNIAKSVFGFTRSRLIDFVSRVGVGLGRTMEQANVVFSISDMSCFFVSRDGRKHQFSQLIPYLDWQSTDIESAAPLLCELAGSHDLMTSYLIVAVLDFHLLKDEHRTLPIMQKMLDRSLANSPPTIQMMALSVVPGFYAGVRRDESLGSVLEYYKHFVRNFYDTSRSRCSSGRRNYILTSLGAFVSLSYYIRREIDIDFIGRYINSAKNQADVDFLAFSVRAFADEAVYQQLARPYLEALSLFFDIDDAKVLESLVAALSKIRSRFPEEVDEFLEDVGAAIELKRKVKTSAVAENLGDLLVYHGLDFLGRAVMLDPESSLMPLFTWWFEEASRARSFSKWIGLLVKAAANLIYGESIFDIGQPELGTRSSEGSQKS